MKNYLPFFAFLFFSCAHSNKKDDSPKDASPIREKGYGDFLFMPPGSIAIRNFVDVDDDKVDDRYQLGPGTKGLPMGHFYKDNK